MIIAIVFNKFVVHVSTSFIVIG